MSAKSSPPPGPLWRNRNYNILWATMLASQLGGETVLVAALLLALTKTRSGLEIGAVSAVFAGARMAASIPAGVLADRRDRRAIMLTAAGISAAALAALAAALYAGLFSYQGLLLVVATVGVCSSAFDPAEQAALPQVVPQAQLSSAIARNVARPFAAMLAGPAMAGFAFALRPFIPFAVSASLLAGATVAVAALRLPARSPGGTDGQRDASDGAARDAALAGIRWALGQPVIRATITWVIVTNLVFNALIIVIIAASGQAGAGQIGLMVACIGIGGLAGAACAPRLDGVLSAPVVVIGSSWVFAAMVMIMTVAPAGVLLGVLLGSAAFFAPVANTKIMTYQLTITPDELRGRLSGLVVLCSEVTGTAGPLVGGLIVTVLGRGAAGILACAAALGLVAVGATASPALRAFPRASQALVSCDR